MDHKQSQSQQILNALLNGEHLSPLDILKRFNCLDGRKRISELRKLYNIQWYNVNEDNGKKYRKHYIPKDGQLIAL